MLITFIVDIWLLISSDECTDQCAYDKTVVLSNVIRVNPDSHSVCNMFDGGCNMLDGVCYMFGCNEQ